MSTAFAVTGSPASLPQPAILSLTEHDRRIVEQALTLLERQLFATGPTMFPDTARDYLRLKLTPEPNEVFAAVFMDSKHRVIAYEVLFKGTIDTAEVHPRVVIQRALAHNASALIVSHNHPSGNTEPSVADRELTTRLKAALAFVDIRLLDHFIVGKGQPFSFASMGLL